MNFDEETEDEDTTPIDIGAALRQAFQPAVEPFWPGFWLNIVLNYFVGPLIVWGALMQAGILPGTLSGFLSVATIALFVRLCILDKGLAKLPYIPVDQTGENDD